MDISRGICKFVEGLLEIGFAIVLAVIVVVFLLQYNDSVTAGVAMPPIAWAGYISGVVLCCCAWYGVSCAATIRKYIETIAKRLEKPKE